MTPPEKPAAMMGRHDYVNTTRPSQGDRLGDGARPAAPTTLAEDMTGAGLDGSAGLAGYMRDTLDRVRDHLGRYILPLHPDDLDILTLWAAHTHLVDHSYTTPRLCLTSPLPESGKTTVLEHFQRLCHRPISMAATGSPALFARMLHAGMRTLMIDEADRNLRPDKDGVEDVLAVLNTGYKRGGVRAVLERNGSGGFDVVEMATFAPLVMAGIGPELPDDTMSRTITVVMLPDRDGRCEPSDWEDIDDDVLALGQELAGACAQAADEVKSADPALPEGCAGRMREKWRPLARIAHAAGPDWWARCRTAIERDIADRDHDREEGLVREAPQIMLLTDIAAEWPEGLGFWSTAALRQALVTRHPDHWGINERFPKGLTEQRIGRYLGRTFNIRSVRRDDDAGRTRGYLWSDIERVAGRLGCLSSNRPNRPNWANRPTEPRGGDPG